MKELLHKSLFISLILLSGFQTMLLGAGQDRRVIKVFDEANNPIDCFNASVVDESDLSTVSVQVGFDGQVTIEVADDIATHCHILIQCLGYRDEQCRLSSAQDNIVILHPDELAAAVVRGHSNPVEVSKGKIVVDVSRTFLKTLPESSDILMRVPGLRLSGTELSVVGKGVPLIVIDGIESSVDDLLRMPPSRIASISLDRNPASQYDAESHSVIVVRTNTETKPSLQISNHTYFGRKLSNQASVNALYSGNKVLHSFQYSFTNQNHYDHVLDYDSIASPTATVKDRVEYSPQYWADIHSFQYGGKWSISRPYSLSWQYTGKFSKGGNAYSMSEMIEKSAATNFTSDINENTRSSNNRFDLLFSWQVDSCRTLDLSSQYVLYTPESSQRIFYPDQSEPLMTENDSQAQSLTVKAEYTAEKDWAEIKSGARYGMISSESSSHYMVSDYFTRFRSNLYGVYAQLESEYDLWGWAAGMRCEGLYDQIVENGRDIERNEWGLFPSLDLYTMGLTDWLDLSISYTGRIQRPSLSDLSAKYQYVNSIVVSSGNPSLKSSRTDNLELDITLWDSFNICFDAIHYTDPMIAAGEMQDDNVVMFRPLNVDKSNRFLIDFTYEGQWKKISFMANAGLDITETRIPYMGSTLDVGGTSPYASIMIDGRFKNNWNASCGFDYVGKSYDLMTEYDPTYNLTASISKPFLKKHLQLTLSGYNLINGMKDVWHDRFGYYETFQKADRDRRYVRVSVKFLFNNFKNRYTASELSEEAQRL